jgi:hypothetical protein
MYETHDGQTIGTDNHSLRSETNRTVTRNRLVVSEAYAPQFALQTMERHKPDLVDRMACRVTHWAVYEDSHKLIHIQDTRDELYDLAEDPTEQRALDHRIYYPRIHELRSRLSRFLERARARRPAGGQAHTYVDLEDEQVRERLRGLGYIE